MTDKLPAEMVEATRLTRAGRYAEATALIQNLLRSKGATASGPASPGASVIINAEATAPDARFPHRIGTAGTGAFVGRLHPKPRTGLGETLRNLAARAAPAGLDFGSAGVARHAPAPLPEGATFDTLSFTNEAGTRSYKLYVPANHAGRPLPLVVMLHGCTQSPDDFAAGTRMNVLAEEVGCLVAYPAQSASANAQKCWNWFNPTDQQRDRGEPSMIAGITRHIVSNHPVDPRRVYIAGLSAGGAAAVVMGMAYPDLYTAVGVHSGLPCGAARDMPSAFAAMRQGAGGIGLRTSGTAVPTIVFHGDQDTTVHPRNGDDVIAQSRGAMTGLRTEIQQGQVPGGHFYTRTVHTDNTGSALYEQWTIQGARHAWSGGSPAGSYTDQKGPDATREMLRFFLEKSKPVRGAVSDLGV